MSNSETAINQPAGHVVVLGTGIVALSTIHTHAHAGLQVTHVSTKTNDIALLSRHSRGKFTAPHPDTDGAGLVRFLLDLPATDSPALLVPVNDPHVELVAINHDELSKRYVLANQSWDIIGGINDKRRLYIRAHELGVPAPWVRFPQTVEELRHQLDGITYPCILKPYQTPKFFALYDQKVLVAKDEPSLLKQFADVRKHELDVMVSEIIPGPDQNLYIYICHLDRDGDVAAEMCVQKIRQHPPDFGVASVIKTVPMIPALREQALQLLHSYGYQGFSATEFKHDPVHNAYRLIEINTRPVLYQRLFLKCGINFDEIMYRDRVEHRKISAPTCPAEIYWIQNFSEILEFRRNLRTRQETWRDFFHPYLQTRIYAVPFLYDPGPFLALSKKLISGFFKRRIQ